MIQSFILLSALFGLVASSPHPLCKYTSTFGDDDSNLVVETENGKVRGCETEGGGTQFTIPYAQPPIGDLRFKGPQPAESWKSIYDGTQFATICPQFGGSEADTEFVGDEDCLYLTVNVPPPNENITGPLPVLYWIYGGAFVLGDTYEFGLYDPKNLLEAHPDVIVVTVQYRVGAFGFLAHEALQAEDATDNNVEIGSTGNMGLRDQRLGMQWVQDNIENFGGDKDKVTIFGESAGAMSVCAHLGNGEANEGLFSGAIMESGTCDSVEIFFNVEGAKSFGDDYSRLVVGCDSKTLGSDEAFLQCMREVDASDLLYGFLKALEPLSQEQLSQLAWYPPLAPIVPFSLTVDGSKSGIPQTPVTAMQNNEAMKVPMIMGNNNDEGTIFVPFVKSMYNVSSWMTLDDFEVVLQDLMCDDIYLDVEECDPSVIIAQYNNCEDYSSVDACAAIVLRDYLFECPTRRAHNAMADTGQLTWDYLFTYQNGVWKDLNEMGDYHMSELYFVWGNPWPIRNGTYVHEFSESDEEMVSYMQNYWTNMAKYGNPNGGTSSSSLSQDFPQWINVEASDSRDGKSYQELTNPPVNVDGGKNDKYCDWWDNWLGL